MVFYSFGVGLYDGYDPHTLANCRKPASLLAWEMNYALLSESHGTPLRARAKILLNHHDKFVTHQIRTHLTSNLSNITRRSAQLTPPSWKRSTATASAAARAGCATS